METISDSWNASEEELQQCWDALVGNDGEKSHAARWRLVAVGDKASDFIEKRLSEEKSKQYFTPNNFIGFRIDRVLQLIDTPKSKELLKR